MTGDQRLTRILEALAPHRVADVWGHDPLAGSVRDALGSRLAAEDQEPDAIVVTASDGDLVIEATQRVASLGTVVVACDAPPEFVRLNVYRDLHARSLTLVGVPPTQSS